MFGVAEEPSLEKGKAKPEGFQHLARPSAFSMNRNNMDIPLDFYVSIIEESTYLIILDSKNLPI